MCGYDGICRTFDKNADGFGFGEACSMLVLMPLDKAIEEGKFVYGILKGSAV